MHSVNVEHEHLSQRVLDGNEVTVFGEAIHNYQNAIVAV
jgi:hypothetical protein